MPTHSSLDSSWEPWMPNWSPVRGFFSWVTSLAAKSRPRDFLAVYALPGLGSFNLNSPVFLYTFYLEAFHFSCFRIYSFRCLLGLFGPGYVLLFLLILFLHLSAEISPPTYSLCLPVLPIPLLPWRSFRVLRSARGIIHVAAIHITNI